MYVYICIYISICIISTLIHTYVSLSVHTILAQGKFSYTITIKTRYKNRRNLSSNRSNLW